MRIHLNSSITDVHVIISKALNYSLRIHNQYIIADTVQVIGLEKKIQAVFRKLTWCGSNICSRQYLAWWKRKAHRECRGLRRWSSVSRRILNRDRTQLVVTWGGWNSIIIGKWCPAVESVYTWLIGCKRCWLLVQDGGLRDVGSGRVFRVVATGGGRDSAGIKNSQSAGIGSGTGGSGRCGEMIVQGGVAIVR